MNEEEEHKEAWSTVLEHGYCLISVSYHSN
jgi:hypothetical protein